MNAETRIKAGAPEVWVVSTNAELLEKVQEVLHPLARVRVLAPAAGGALEEALREGGPPLIVLDVGGQVNWGMRMIQAIKRSPVPISTVIMTEQFSREFGRKILSEGISYYFSYDFCRSEFLQLVTSILKVDENTLRGETARGRKKYPINDRKDPVV